MKDLQAQLILVDWLDKESSGNSQVYLAEEEKIISAMEQYATLKLSERQNNFDDLLKFLRMVNDCLSDGIPIEKDDPIHNIAKKLLESLK